MSREIEDREADVAIAVVEPLSEASLVPIFGKDVDPYEVHSFNMADPVQSLQYVNAVGGETKPLRKFEGDVIEVSFYYVKPISFSAGKNDPRYAEGEIINGLRCVLVTPNGEQYHTTSPTQIKMIGAVHKTPLGKKEFKPPLRFRIGEQQTRQGWETQTLTLLPAAIQPVNKPA